MAFQPVMAKFDPPQVSKGGDVAVFIFPDDHELCYEWHYQKTIVDGQTLLHMCCGCSALKKRQIDNHMGSRSLLPYQIANGWFISDPGNLPRSHFCQSRSTAKTVARRLVIESCEEIRSSEPHVLKAPSTELARSDMPIEASFQGN